MIDYLIFGVADGDFCNDFLTPPHMWWWLGKAIGRVVGCYGQESMIPLLLVVVAITTWHLMWLRRTHLRKEGAR